MSRLEEYGIPEGKLSKDEIVNRINLLNSEMDAHRDELYWMEQEVHFLYNCLDNGDYL
jgi:hypothetical protein